MRNYICIKKAISHSMWKSQITDLYTRTELKDTNWNKLQVVYSGEIRSISPEDFLHHVCKSHAINNLWGKKDSSRSLRKFSKNNQFSVAKPEPWTYKIICSFQKHPRCTKIKMETPVRYEKIFRYWNEESTFLWKEIMPRPKEKSQMSQWPPFQSQIPRTQGLCNLAFIR